jgi:protocatechuate 3,4-dioxygenase alpha subunit
MFFDASKDPVLDAVPSHLRGRLIAKRQGSVYRFDIRLRGDGETPFFDD